MSLRSRLMRFCLLVPVRTQAAASLQHRYRVQTVDREQDGVTPPPGFPCHSVPSFLWPRPLRRARVPCEAQRFTMEPPAGAARL